VREFLLEVWFNSYRASMSVSGTDICDEIRRFLPLHVVSDCPSLHGSIIKSGLPENKRCALEVLAIREMLTLHHYYDEEDAEEETERLAEKDLRHFFHCSVSEDQKADVLTKITNRLQRDEWHSFVAWVSIRSAKRTDEKLKLAVPSRPGAPVDKSLAETLVKASNDAAVAAGYAE
jgi:hypothetical protein